MDIKLLEKKKRAVVSQWHMNYLLNELKLLFDSDFKFLPIRNTGIKIYTQWQVLVVDFWFENSDIVLVKLTGDWCKFYINMLKSCILKTFKWEFIPENNCCCGVFAKKNQLRFYI